MPKNICNRCGGKCEERSLLTLFMPRRVLTGPASRSYEFDLCERCARDVFAFIGNQPTVQNIAFVPTAKSSVQKR